MSGPHGSMFKTSALLSALALGASSSGLVSAERATALYPHVPLVLWSQHATLKAREAYVGAVFDEVATADVLHTVLSRDAHKDNYNVLSTSASAEPTAEALCVFVHENLKSSQLAAFGPDSFVQSAVKTASSSVIVAHTTRSQSLTQALAGVDHPIVPIDSVTEWIQSAEGKKLLSNGKSDLLVVTIPGNGDERELGEADAKIKRAAEALLEASKDAGIDFALTGNSAQSIVVKDPFARRSRRLATGQAVTAESIICDAGYLIGLSSTGKAYCFSHYVHMTPEILTALIFGFFFLFLAYVGLTALHAIQTPLRYPLHGPPKGKEF